MEWVLFVLILLIVLTIFIMQVRRALQKRPTCPNCEQQTAAKIDQHARDVKVHDYPGGGEGGGRTTVQMELEVTYHCRACGHRWREIVTAN